VLPDRIMTTDLTPAGAAAVRALESQRKAEADLTNRVGGNSLFGQ
jgi:hypothetical protein